MSPLNESQLEQIRHERKEQIMNAALKVFSENGIKLTKISMIAKEAGVSHGLVYHYFKSKEEVLYESVKWATEDVSFLGEIQAMLLTPLEKIRYFTKLSLAEGNSDVFRVILHIEKVEDVPEQTRLLTKNAGMMYIKYLLPLFIEGQAIGEIIQGDPEELIALYLTVISGIMIEGNFQWWKENIDEKVRILTRMLEVR